MIRQASVQDITNERVTKRHGRIVVVTRYYPRYLKKKLIDDYFAVLAPPKALLHEFKGQEEAMDADHDGAFDAIDYESKFTLSEEGLAILQELAIESASKPVYLVCHCKLGQRCHREILMLAARELFGAQVAKVYFEYPTISARLSGAGLLAQ
ncbi:MAG: DUF488 family protein [Bdellovibrionota bacterium]